VPGDAAVVSCMGDTLLHLPSEDAVRDALHASRERLAPGGRFVASFRDLTQELVGADRFVDVRSDPDRILTCFLEYGPDRVTVHDLLHVREGVGWRLRKSAYDKLRLAPQWVERALHAAGFSRVSVDGDGPLRVATAVAPQAPAP
jgi:hypothetical protein